MQCEAHTNDRTDGHWCIRKTFLEVDGSDDDKESPPRRASSEPPQRRKTDKEDLEDARKLVEELREQVEAAESMERDLEEELSMAEQWAIPSGPCSAAVERLEIDLADTMERCEAANSCYDTEAMECNRVQMRAAGLQADLRQEIEAKTAENQLLEEECDELKLEAEAARVQLAHAKKGEVKMHETARKERIAEEAAPWPTLLAHRRRTEALMALSEARAAATAAKDEQDQAQRAEQMAFTKLKEKEAMNQKEMKRAEESMLRQEASLIRELAGLEERLEKAQKSKQETEWRHAHWANRLQKNVERLDKMKSKVEQAELKAISMQKEAANLTRKVQEATDARKVAEADLAVADDFRAAALNRLYIAIIAFFAMLLFVLCAFGLVVRF